MKKVRHLERAELTGSQNTDLFMNRVCPKTETKVSNFARSQLTTQALKMGTHRAIHILATSLHQIERNHLVTEKVNVERSRIQFI